MSTTGSDSCFFFGSRVAATRIKHQSKSPSRVNDTGRQLSKPPSETRHQPELSRTTKPSSSSSSKSSSSSSSKSSSSSSSSSSSCDDDDMEMSALAGSYDKVAMEQDKIATQGLDKLRGKKSKPKRKREDDDELNSDDNDTKEEDPLDLTQVKIADMLDKHLAGLLEFEPPPELPKKEGSVSTAAATSLLHPPLGLAEKKAKKLAREKLKKERKRALQLLGGREAAQGSIDANTGDGDKDDERTDEDEGEGNAGGESSCGDDGGVREGKGGVANQPNTPLTPEQKKAKKLLGEKKKKERKRLLKQQAAEQGDGGTEGSADDAPETDTKKGAEITEESPRYASKEAKRKARKLRQAEAAAAPTPTGTGKGEMTPGNSAKGEKKKAAAVAAVVAATAAAPTAAAAAATAAPTAATAAPTAATAAAGSDSSNSGGDSDAAEKMEKSTEKKVNTKKKAGSHGSDSAVEEDMGGKKNEERNTKRKKDITESSDDSDSSEEEKEEDKRKKKKKMMKADSSADKEVVIPDFNTIRFFRKVPLGTPVAYPSPVSVIQASRPGARAVDVVLAGTRYAPPSRSTVKEAMKFLVVEAASIFASAPPNWKIKSTFKPPTAKQSKKTGVVVEGIYIEGKKEFVPHEERIAKLLLLLGTQK